MLYLPHFVLVLVSICRCLLHSEAMQLSAANMAILKNMSDLMTREVWGAYEDSYKKRVLQLKKVR